MSLANDTARYVIVICLAPYLDVEGRALPQKQLASAVTKPETGTGDRPAELWIWRYLVVLRHPSAESLFALNS